MMMMFLEGISANNIGRYLHTLHNGCVLVLVTDLFFFLLGVLLSNRHK
jgi:hypothetical protein